MALTFHQKFDDVATTLAGAALVGPTMGLVRAGTSTRVNSSGLVENVASNLPRFDHELITGTRIGLLVEESAVQLAIWTEDTSNAAWVASNITKETTSVNDPTGAASTTVRLTASAGNGTLLQSLTSTSNDRGYAVYMKRVTGTGDIDLTVDGGATWTTVVLTSSWQRLEINQAAVTDPQFGVRIVTSGDAIDFWGSQLENTAWSTSYIRNNSATASVTRNDENYESTDVTWYNDAALTAYIDAIRPADVLPTTAYLFTISANNTTDYHYLRAGVLTTTWAGESGNSSIYSQGHAQTYGARHRFVIGAQADDFVFYSDGVQRGTDSSGSMPVGISQINIGEWHNSSLQWGGHIKEMRCYDERLDNTALLDMSNGTFPTVGGGGGGSDSEHLLGHVRSHIS